MDQIALIAHDDKKNEVISFARGQANLLKIFPLLATHTSGEYLLKGLLTVRRSDLPS